MAREPQFCDEMELHLTARRVACYSAAWIEDPEAVSDDEFFSIQDHLLTCQRCAAAAKAYEDRETVRLSLLEVG